MVQARGPRWRFHRPHALGVVMPAIPVYRKIQDDSHPTQCCRLNCFAQPCTKVDVSGCDTLLKKWKYSGVWVSTCVPVPVSSEDRSDANRKPTVRQALCSGHYNINSKSKTGRDAVVRTGTYPYVNTVPPKYLFSYITYSYIFYITKHRIYGDQATTKQAIPSFNSGCRIFK